MVKNKKVQRRRTNNWKDVADVYLKREGNQRLYQMLQRLPDTIASLDVPERHLIEALYIKGVSVRGHGQIKGASAMTIRKRRNQILKKIDKILPK